MSVRRHWWRRIPILAFLLLTPMTRGDAQDSGVVQGGSLQAPAISQEAMSEYRRKLDEYDRARQGFEAEASVYWAAVSEKRAVRNGKRQRKEPVELQDYMLDQPPAYSGPPRPVDPSIKPGEEPIVPKRTIPVVADFLWSAKEHFQFEPQRPASELEYKQVYAKAAKAAGLSTSQIVRIYGFESGGNGKYDVQAGLEYVSPKAQAISTALGYNQLLATNSIHLLAEKGEQFVDQLKLLSKQRKGEQKEALDYRISVVERMIRFCRTVPVRWSEHEKLARTPQGLGVHALNLDVDIGPLLQTQKLLDSLVFAKRRGIKNELTAAELEMMNLTGDGNGFDMIGLPTDWRDRIPTSNFFQRSGYERNPVAIRNNVVSKLLAATDAKMDKESKLQGAKDLATLLDSL